MQKVTLDSLSYHAQILSLQSIILGNYLNLHQQKDIIFRPSICRIFPEAPSGSCTISITMSDAIIPNRYRLIRPYTGSFIMP